MDVLNGTRADGPIRLGFTRDEFDQVCKQLRSDGAGCTEYDSGAVGTMLRLQGVLADDGSAAYLSPVRESSSGASAGSA